jgi:hypothetical protein
MKHIKLYEEQEPDKGGKMLGVIVHVFGYGRDIHMDDYYACVAPTFWDIATAILEDYMDPDDVEEEVSKMTSLYDLLEAISNWVDQADELDITIWTGLIPRSQSEEYKSTGNSNPYDAVDDIDSVFTNAKSVMLANKGGASNNDLIKLIGDSIANDPSKFALYAENDDLDKIIKSIGWPEDKVKSLLRYSNIRNQI